MIVITGGAGFIGSCLVHQLNACLTDPERQLMIIDHLSNGKWMNLQGIQFRNIMDYIKFNADIFGNLTLFHEEHPIKCIIHLGARSNTTENNESLIYDLNVTPAKRIMTWAIQHNVPVIHASSAAIYGDSDVFDDTKTRIYRPLNIYGWTKQLVDEWIEDTNADNIMSLRFFNVYGPNEYHKHGMSSIIPEAAKIASIPNMRYSDIELFKSFHPNYKDGEQKRDFVYVKDVVAIIRYFMNEQFFRPGIYNVGTGQARSWNELGKIISDYYGKEFSPKYIDAPETIKKQYQNYTCADITRLKQILPTNFKFETLEEGVSNYLGMHIEQTGYQKYYWW